MKYLFIIIVLLGILASSCGRKITTVTAGGGDQNIPDPPPAPTCNLVKSSVITEPAQALQFTLSVNGAATYAMVNGILITGSAPVDSSYVLTINPDPDGSYNVFAEVRGPGGIGLCDDYFTPPSCQLEAHNITYTSANLRLTLQGAVISVLVDDQDITPLPIPPENTIDIPKNFSGGTHESEAILVSPTGDTGFCSLAYLAGAPQIINVVISFISEAHSTFSMSPTQINLHSSNYHALGDLQILVVREDGSEVIEVDRLYPFGEPVPSGNNDKSITGDFGKYLIGNAIPYDLHVSESSFAIQTEFVDSEVSLTSNRNGIDILQCSDSVISLEVNDTSYWSGYYQVAMCKTGYSCPYYD